MKISDFKGLFSKHILSIVSIENPHSDYYVVTLKADKRISWIPGDHAIFTLPDKKIAGKKFRAFSLASTPSEGIIRLGTRSGKVMSSFKKEFLAMKAGEKVAMRGPFGWFKVKDETSPIVMVAGGVGITPIHALITDLQTNTNRPIDIIYSSKDYYLFEESIQDMVKKNTQMTLYKTSSRAETEKKLDELLQDHGKKGYYYVSGSMPFIKGVKKQIVSKQVKSNRIINDPFFGY